MASYNVHAGHCPDNQGACGAIGYLKESTEARRVKNYVIKYLEEAGQEVFDCTYEKRGTREECLQSIVSKCNQNKVELDISIHLNSGGGTGCEVLNYDVRTREVSDRICKNVSTLLGIRNRGTKYAPELYVLKNTINLAVLIECCFVDCEIDKTAWNPELCAKGIVEGILGKTIQRDNIDSEKAFLVKIMCELNIREKPGIDSRIVNTICDKGVYTIIKVEYVNGVPWGKLKSGQGWISIHSKYVRRLTD